MSENGKLTLLGALILVLLLITGLRGCGGYGEVGTHAYDHAKALYSICNRQDGERLKAFSASLAEATREGKISEKEQAWLEKIVVEAQAGNWQEATAMSRRLMEDQVAGGP